MRLHSARARTFSVNSLFPSFLLAVFGWGLLHAWGFAAKAGTMIHILIAVPGLALCGLASYRYMHHWPHMTKSPTRGTQGKGLPRHYREAAPFLIPIAVGFGLALIVMSGSVFLLVLSTVGLMCIRWTNLALCRNHFFFMAVSSDACAALGMALAGNPMRLPYHAAAASYMLALGSAALIFVMIANGNRRDRMPVAGYPSDPTVNGDPRSPHQGNNMHSRLPQP